MNHLLSLFALALCMALAGCATAAPAAVPDAAPSDIAPSDASPSDSATAETTQTTSGLKQLATDPVAQPIACDAQHVWYSSTKAGLSANLGALQRLAHGGGSPTALGPFGYFAELLVDGDYLYWHKPTNTSTKARWIQRMPKAGAAEESLSTLAFAIKSRLRVAGGYVWFLAEIADGKTLVPGYYKLATQAGSTPELVWKLAGIPSGSVVVHGAAALVLANSTGNILKILSTVDGAEQTVNLTRKYSPPLVSDGVSLYGVTMGTSKLPASLVRIDLQGALATETVLVPEIAPAGSGGSLVLAGDGIVIFQRPNPSVAGNPTAPDLMAVAAQGGAATLVAAGTRLADGADGFAALCGKNLFWLEALPSTPNLKATSHVLRSAKL